MNVASPYRGLAGIYDAVVGDAAFPAIHGALQRAILNHGIRFESAADVGCGTGRGVQCMARPGRRVYGVDRSNEMLSLAARRPLRGPTRLLCQDVRTLALPEKVDLITLNFAVLNYLTSFRSLAGALNACRKNLRRGGWLVFDVLTGAGEGPRDGRTIQVVETPDARSLWSIEVDRRRGTTVTDMKTCFDDGRCYKERHVQRWWPSHVVRRALEAARLQTVSVRALVSGALENGRQFWVQFVSRRR